MSALDDLRRWADDLVAEHRESRGDTLPHVSLYVQAKLVPEPFRARVALEIATARARALELVPTAAVDDGRQTRYSRAG